MKNRLAGFSILVVEDDSDMRKTLSDYFKKIGATIFSASDGSEALKILEVEKVDLVLSDVQMPVMDGTELLKRIRAKDPRIPTLLFVTGQSQLTEETAANLGAAGLIHKPFNLKELTEKVVSLIQIANSSAA